MNAEFSFKTRAEDIKRIYGSEFEVLIIGGGISGAGIANLLAENAIRPVLIDKGDFASGTSSGSSKLIHGGLRYLANGEFREVRDLLKERDYLIKHSQIVSPLRFHILVDNYSWRKSTIRLGLFLYSLLSGRLRISRFRKNRGIYPDSVEGYFEYEDAFTDDSKLVIYNIVSARRRGSICLNYLAATSVEREGGKFRVRLRDELDGSEFELRAKYVINAAGPWAAGIMEMFGLKLESQFRLSKGIHIVLPAEKIPVKDAIAFRTRIDRRQMFVIPRGEVVHVGTTDTFVDDPNCFTVTDADLDYVIGSIQPLFPGVGRGDIITSFSGLRPLFGNGDDPGEVSRDFKVLVNGNIINVLGGKVTNYRSAARKVGKILSEVMGMGIRTSGLPTIGYSRPEVLNIHEYIIHNECPMTLDDIMRRREALRIYTLDRGASVEGEVRKEMEKAGMVVR